MVSYILLISGLLFSGGVAALEDYNNFAEGPCDPNLPSQPWINRDFVDSLHLFTAGSKYHFYKMASANPRYKEMTVDEFYYDFCYQRNTSSTSESSIAAAIGFGDVLATFDITVPNGFYIEAVPRSGFPRWDSLRHRITLTDHKSFAFVSMCWIGSNQRAWNVVSNTSALSSEARKAIEEHANSLGFNRRNNVFIRHDSCRNNHEEEWSGHKSLRVQGHGLDRFGGSLNYLRDLNKYL